MSEIPSGKATEEEEEETVDEDEIEQVDPEVLSDHIDELVEQLGELEEDV